MNACRAALLAAVALSVCVVGCRPPRAPAATPVAGLQCDRGYAVSAVNNTAKDVDIWQSTGAGWDFIGSVPARSTREMPLATGNQVEWRWPPQALNYDPNLSIDVTLRMHCT